MLCVKRFKFAVLLRNRIPPIGPFPRGVNRTGLVTSVRAKKIEGSPMAALDGRLLDAGDSAR
tara:strand:+ start:22337 stop:22522 length:186 start_codon:yes stop_codon:yes gene_type:complete